MTPDQISFCFTLLLLALGSVVLVLVIIVLVTIWEEYGRKENQNQKG